MPVIWILFTPVYSLVAQTSKDYWQQDVHYNIEVSLNDKDHILTGQIRTEYINNSPTPISFIYLHLWPNAYSSKQTPFAKSILQEGNADFQFSKPEQRGYIDSLHFTSDGKALRLDYEDASHEIAILFLPSELPPGGHFSYETPFVVKLPETYSRMGHDGQSYQITQWYPKPAVYDAKGWHPLHYFDQGEFYSEFGSYEVKITLPSNYVIGSTGEVMEESEKAFMEKKAAETAAMSSFPKDMSFPPSSAEMKTLTYKAEKVHDFAWFADKRFHVAKDTVNFQLSGRQVYTWGLFTNAYPNAWRKSASYIKHAIEFYSLKLGEYPYPQATAADAVISAGGGMEYPMATVIGEVRSAQELDLVIAHEVGHNWLYGILGSNERSYAWMDEGINSFYEDEYMDVRYPGAHFGGGISAGFLGKLLDIQNIPRRFEKEIAYLFCAMNNSDQPLSTSAEKFTGMNYGGIVYSKTAFMLRYLQAYLNRDGANGRFDSLMHRYFEQWKFKHPKPEDFTNAIQESCRENLDWFFKDLLNTNKKIDYKVRALKKNPDGSYILKLKNHKGIEGPIAIGNFDKKENVDSVKSLIWIEGFKDEIDIQVPASEKDFIGIDPGRRMPDINRNNNQTKTHGIFKMFEPLRIQLGGSLDNPLKSQLNIFPLVGWNNADKTMVGMAFYNNFLPMKRWEIMLAPMFGTGSKKVAGFFNLTYHAYPKQLKDLSFEVNGRTFSYGDFYDPIRKRTRSLEYYKISPFIHFTFRNKDPKSTIYKELNIRPVFAIQAFESDFVYGKKVYHFYNTNEVKFTFGDRKVTRPYSIVLMAQQCKDFMTLSASAKLDIAYNKKLNKIHFRIFGGGFLYHHNQTIDPVKGILPPRRDLTISSNPANGNYKGRFNEDFTYDELYLDRSGTEKVLSHQVFTNKEGGFRSMIPGFIGSSDKWILTAGISAELPKHIPLKPFVNMGTGYLFDNKSFSFKHGVFLAEAGISIVGWEDIFEIHFPLLVTKNIREAQADQFGIRKFYERITFTLDLNLVNPLGRLRNIRL